MEPAPVSERRGIGLMLLSIALFTTNVLLLRGIALAAPSIDGWVATVFRGGVGLAIAALLYRGRGFRPRHLLSEPLVLLRGAVGAASVLLFYLTIEPLGAGRAVVINLSYPIFGAVMARIWLREPLSLRQWTWMAAGLVGLGIFLSGEAFHSGLHGAEILGFLGAVLAGAAVVLIRRLSHREHPSTVYASQCLWSLAVALPVAGAPLASIPPTALTVLIAASVVVAGGQLALTHSFRHLSVAKGSSLQMLLPLATALGGWMLFDERFAPAELAGACLTLLATCQVIRHQRRLPGAVAPPPTAATSSKVRTKHAAAVGGAPGFPPSRRTWSSSSRNPAAPDQTV